MKFYALCHQTMMTESLKSPLKGRVLWDESGDTDVKQAESKTETELF